GGHIDLSEGTFQWSKISEGHFTATDVADIVQRYTPDDESGPLFMFNNSLGWLLQKVSNPEGLSAAFDTLSDERRASAQVAMVLADQLDAAQLSPDVLTIAAVTFLKNTTADYDDSEALQSMWPADTWAEALLAAAPGLDSIPIYALGQLFAVASPEQRVAWIGRCEFTYGGEVERHIEPWWVELIDPITQKTDEALADNHEQKRQWVTLAALAHVRAGRELPTRFEDPLVDALIGPNQWSWSDE